LGIVPIFESFKIFHVLPIYNFGRIITEIQKTIFSFSFSTLRPYDMNSYFLERNSFPTIYSFSNLLESWPCESSIGCNNYSSLISINFIWIFNLVVIILCWYFDHIISSNNGVGNSFFFFLKRSFYGISKWNGEKNSTPLKVENLKKSFSSCFKTLDAVNDVNFTEENLGICISLLGQNGAGKSVKIELLIKRLSLEC
jgi:hypothetical protein